MSNPKYLLLGCGYTLSRLAKTLPASCFLAVVSSNASAQALTLQGIDSRVCNIEDLAALRDLIGEFPSLEVLIDSIPPLKSAEPTLGVRNIITAIASSNIQRVLYLSTSGVYGGSNGDWVDENTIPNPYDPKAQARLDCENLYRQTKLQNIALRIVGIYGPDRGMGNSIKSGRIPDAEAGQRWTNRIHVDDLVAVIENIAKTTRALPAVMNICDDLPTKVAEVSDFYVSLLGVKVSETAPTSSRKSLSQRVSNKLMKEFTGLNLKYPSYLQGAVPELCAGINELKIGTRPSILATTQTDLVSSLVAEFVPNAKLTSVVVRTSGDNKQEVQTPIARDKRDWIQELEAAIISGGIDFAVHSGKDVPHDVDPATVLHSIHCRANPQDLFIGKRVNEKKRLAFKDLPDGAKIGTASLRRQAQLKLLNPSLKVVELRGNVNTRISKLDQDSELFGIVLAAAGVARLGMNLAEFEILPSESFLPAAAQGILTVQFRKDRQDLKVLLNAPRVASVEAALMAERAVVRCLEADCHSALAVFSNVEEGKLKISAKVFCKTSPKFIEAKIEGQVSEAEKLGNQLGQILIEHGAKDLLK